MRELWGWKMIIEDWGLRVEHWGLRINDRGLIINSGGWGWWMEGRGLRIEYWGLKIEDGGLRIEDWGSRIEDWGLRIKDWGSRIEDRGLIIICRESRYFEDILKWSIFRLRTFYIFFQVWLSLYWYPTWVASMTKNGLFVSQLILLFIHFFNLLSIAAGSTDPPWGYLWWLIPTV